MRHGILLVDKPSGITSHDVVQKIRKALHEPKVGHLGTLDPLATGLLVLFVGKKALKTIELFMDTEKAYETRLIFGATSSTYDREGVIEKSNEKKGWTPPTQVQLQEILRNHFLGNIVQKPPSHSAVHIDGHRAYDIIRKNPDALIDMPERDVTISYIQLVSYEYPNAFIRIGCSSGTYIRSIVHDLGQIVRSGAYVDTLRRTRVGQWDIEDAQKIENSTWGNVMPLKEVLADFPRYDADREDWEHIQHGRTINIKIVEEPLIAWYENLPVAILERKEGKAKARKVL